MAAATTLLLKFVARQSTNLIEGDGHGRSPGRENDDGDYGFGRRDRAHPHYHPHHHNNPWRQGADRRGLKLDFDQDPNQPAPVLGSGFFIARLQTNEGPG